MKIVLNYEIAAAFERAAGINVLPLKPYDKLALPVCAHADMLTCIIDKKVFSYSDYIEYNKEAFEEMKRDGYEVVECTPPVSQDYPSDVGLNVAVVGKRVFCRVQSVAKEIKDYVLENGYELIDVKQGYAGCTTLVLNENNAVTGDPSIKIAMEKSGINVLFIDEDNIRLPGYNKGFIGGASLVINDTVYFFGDVKKLSEYSKISSFISSLKMKEISILSGDVVDFGGGKVI